MLKFSDIKIFVSIKNKYKSLLKWGTVVFLRYNLIKGGSKILKNERNKREITPKT